jgi:hypothetical protein
MTINRQHDNYYNVTLVFALGWRLTFAVYTTHVAVYSQNRRNITQHTHQSYYFTVKVCYYIIQQLKQIQAVSVLKLWLSEMDVQ